jgi:hypothetical protein
MKLVRVRASQGAQWVRSGFRAFFRQPLGYSALFALIGFAALLLAQLPLIGPVAALATMPLATLVFMQATRELLAGRRVQPTLLLQPLRDAAQRRGLLQLGAVYAAATIGIVLLAHVADGGRFTAAAEAVATQTATPEMMSDPMLEFGLLLRLLLLSLLSLLFWHTPALVCWHGMPVGKALFASWVACWRNLGAFAVYGLAWMGLLIGFVLAMQMLFALIGLAQAAASVVVPAVMLVSTVFYASLYFVYADSFELEQ